jgi:hypothetical protein
MAVIPQSMFRDATLDQTLRDRVAIAGGAFTQNQIQRMDRAHVRFWQHEGLPAEFVQRFQLPPSAGLHRLKRAHYLHQIKVIRLLPSATPTHIIHELAHAWDHVRDGRMQASPAMRRMFDLYKGRVRGNDRLPFYSAYERYSLTDALEFYAEGYTVFHHPTPNEQQQLRLLRFAPELYEFLAREGQGLPQPNRQRLNTLTLQ